jgi:hypothetical protein
VRLDHLLSKEHRRRAGRMFPRAPMLSCGALAIHLVPGFPGPAGTRLALRFVRGRAGNAGPRGRGGVGTLLGPEGTGAFGAGLPLRAGFLFPPVWGGGGPGAAVS